jgi:hypothetical protein
MTGSSTTRVTQSLKSAACKEALVLGGYTISSHAISMTSFAKDFNHLVEVINPYPWFTDTVLFISLFVWHYWRYIPEKNLQEISDEDQDQQKSSNTTSDSYWGKAICIVKGFIMAATGGASMKGAFSILSDNTNPMASFIDNAISPYKYPMIALAMILGFAVGYKLKDEVQEQLNTLGKLAEKMQNYMEGSENKTSPLARPPKNEIPDGALPPLKIAQNDKPGTRSASDEGKLEIQRELAEFRRKLR